VELLAALTIAGIMLGFATLNMPDWIESQLTKTQLNEMASAIQTARQTALRYNVNVTMCPLQPAPAVTQSGHVPACGPRNTWHNGTLVFTDRNSNRIIDEEDRAIVQLQPLRDARIYWRAFRNRSYLRFTGRGITEWQNGHFLYCPDSKQQRHFRQIVLNHAGRIYFSNDHDSDGVHEDRSGAPLSCPS